MAPLPRDATTGLVEDGKWVWIAFSLFFMTILAMIWSICFCACGGDDTKREKKAKKKKKGAKKVRRANDKAKKAKKKTVRKIKQSGETDRTLAPSVQTETTAVGETTGNSESCDSFVEKMPSVEKMPTSTPGVTYKTGGKGECKTEEKQSVVFGGTGTDQSALVGRKGKKSAPKTAPKTAPKKDDKRSERSYFIG